MFNKDAGYITFYHLKVPEYYLHFVSFYPIYKWVKLESKCQKKKFRQTVEN